MDDGDDADTILVPRTPWRPSLAVDAVGDSAHADADDDASEDTVIRPAKPTVAAGSEDSEPDTEAADSASGRPGDDAGAPAKRDVGTYRYRLNDRPPSSLRRVAIIGRKPGPPRMVGSDEIELVGVPSPLREVSTTHLEVRQHGQSVVVTDLHSTNGTRVTIPGAEPVALRPGESMVVMPGSIIDIGDSNRIEILPMRLPLHHDLPIERLLP